MSENQILKCLIAFVLGFLFARMFRGNGLNVGGDVNPDSSCGYVPKTTNFMNCYKGLFDNQCGDGRYCQRSGWCGDKRVKSCEWESFP